MSPPPDKRDIGRYGRHLREVVDRVRSGPRSDQRAATVPTGSCHCWGTIGGVHVNPGAAPDEHRPWCPVAKRAQTTGKQPCPCGYGTDGIEYHALDCPKNPASAALNEEQR